MSRGSLSCIFYTMCTAIHNCSSLGSLVFATDAELYKNVTNMICNYSTFYNNVHSYNYNNII